MIFLCSGIIAVKLRSSVGQTKRLYTHTVWLVSFNCEFRCDVLDNYVSLMILLRIKPCLHIISKITI